LIPRLILVEGLPG